jgi:protein-disulfide isomerase
VHLAEKLGVEGTPTVFVNGVRLSGAPNQASLLSAISTPRRGAVR